MPALGTEVLCGGSNETFLRTPVFFQRKSPTENMLTGSLLDSESAFIGKPKIRPRTGTGLEAWRRTGSALGGGRGEGHSEARAAS